MEIIQEKENPLFGRKEIHLEIQSDLMPKKTEMEEFISKKISVPRENIKIKKISSKFGSNTFKIIANIYKTKEEKERVEFKSKKEKEAEKKAVEEKPAEVVSA